MVHVARIALAAAFLIACNGPVAGAPATGTPSPWRDRGEQMCTRAFPDTDPPCGAATFSGVAVWSGVEVVALRESLARIVVPGVDNAALLRCDLARFPVPRLQACMARTTCPNADAVVGPAYVRGVVLEFQARGCW